MPGWLHLSDIIESAPLLLRGLALTLGLSLCAAVLSWGFGLSVAVIRYFGVPGISQALAGLVYLIRSIPVVMLMVFIHFGALPALGFQNSFFLSALVALSISTTAYLSEIFRSGFASLGAEEYETAVCLGLNVMQRLIYVFIPLVLLRVLPATVNQFVTLIKDTSLASIIGVIELTRSAEIVYERTLHEMTMLAFVALVYFVICYTLSRFSERLAVLRKSAVPL